MQEQSTDRIHPTLIPVFTIAPGDHLYEKIGQGLRPQVWQVVTAVPYSDPDGTPMIGVTLDSLTGTGPELARWRSTAGVRPATPEQVADALGQCRREHFARDLYALAGLVLDKRITPAVWLGASVTINVWAGEIEGVAERLGLPLAPDGPDSLRVQWTAPGATDRGDRLSVTITGRPAKAPAPTPAPLATPAEREQEWFFTFGSGHAFDCRFVRITGTYNSARDRMLQVFGRAWCAQYDRSSFRAEGLPGLLVELPESEWPQTGDQADKDCPDAWHTSPVEPTEPCPACGDSAQPSINLNRTAQAGE